MENIKNYVPLQSRLYSQSKFRTSWLSITGHTVVRLTLNKRDDFARPYRFGNKNLIVSKLHSE